MSGDPRPGWELPPALRPRVELRVNGRVILDDELQGLAAAVLDRPGWADALRPGMTVELRVSIAGVTSGQWAQYVVPAAGDPDDPGPVPPRV